MDVNIFHWPIFCDKCTLRIHTEKRGLNILGKKMYRHHWSKEAVCVCSLCIAILQHGEEYIHFLPVYLGNFYLFSNFCLVAVSFVKPALTSFFSGLPRPKNTSLTALITSCWISFFFICFHHYFVNSLSIKPCCVYFCVPNAQPQGLEWGKQEREEK